MIMNNLDTRNLVKAGHKPSNSLGNAQVLNRIMYPITQVPSQTNTGANNSQYGSVNSSQQNSSRHHYKSTKRPSKNRRMVLGGGARLGKSNDPASQPTEPDYGNIH